MQQPALVATSLAVLAALRARGIEPDYVVGHSVGEFAALGGRRRARRSTRRSRSCASAGSRWPRRRGERPGSMAAILGLEDEVVEALCRKIIGVWPANYNCPGQLVVSGEDAAVDECCCEAEREGARRAVKLKVSGAFHSPLVARAADRAAARDRARAVRRAGRAVHVDGDARRSSRRSGSARCSSSS